MGLSQFEGRKIDLLHTIEHRLETYTQALRSGIGLFKASATVDRGEWREFVKALEMQTVFPGIQGLGYAEFIRPQDRKDYERSIQREGFPGFAIRPEGVREIYSSITFLEPFDLRNRQALGYDMYSQKTRRQAMDLARDSGQPAISGKVTLVQEITDDVQSGFLFYLPYYGQGDTPSNLAERRNWIVGYVYSAFRMDDLMKGILGASNPHLNLRIYDGTQLTDDTLMYETTSIRGASETPAKYRHEVPFKYAQHEWTLVISTEPSFEAEFNSTDAQIVLVAGLITSLLVFGIQWSFATTGDRAQALASKMTESLEERTKELSRSNEELERFAYAASHDLRSPLRAIDNLATWLEEDLGESLTGENRRHLNLMRSRIGRMDSLLEGLLQYSRIGRTEHDVQLIDSNELVQSAVELVHVPAGISVTIQPNLPKFFTHKTPLLHVLQNLIANAVKHHDRETGHIEINGRDLGSHVSFTVSDDGPGIAEEFHERIFGMFQTLKRRDEVEASGMGLAMVERYVDEYGGVVRVKSGSNQRGSLFRFTWKKSAEPGEAESDL